ncbi:MAG: SPOR domain-containing protein [Sinobacteraceae bacterium]|nr:SPOR domain-containing protein [Nevskiaceae bacterium]
MTRGGASPRIGRMGPRVFSLVLLCLLAGCSDLQDWRSTQRADTLEAYQAFVDGHPESQYVTVAERRILELTEDRDWRIANERDSAESYRSFINAYPRGRWANEAKVRLQNFLTTPGVIGPAAVEPVESPPPPAMLPPVPPEEVLLPSGGASTAGGVPSPAAAASTPAGVAPSPATAEPAPVTHRIQLGAFSSRELALEAWRAAREQQEQLQGLVAQVVEVPATVNSPTTRVFRLQAGVASEARAREICAALSAARQACVYVLPGR